MANPTNVTLTEKQWVKFATTQSGFVSQELDGGAFKYFWTSRDAGQPAPSNSDKTDGGLALPLFENSRREEISSSITQDFYGWIENSDTTTIDTVNVRVDL